MADWQLTWNGNVWTDDDFTGQHAALLCLIYKVDSWQVLAQNPLDDPIALQAYLAAFIAVAEGRDCLQVQVEITQTPMGKLIDAVGRRPLPAPVGDRVDLPAPQ